MIAKKLKTIAVATAVVAAGTAIVSCSESVVPVTWNAIAGTIPSDVNYVVAVNTGLVKDSAISSLVSDSEMGALLHEALGWEGEHPDHLIIVGSGDAKIVTWPLTDPESASEATADWDQTSLNGTVDARIKQTAEASIVVSSTQVWVVSTPHGDNSVNDLLSGAMNSPASNNEPLNAIITQETESIDGVLAFNDRYYRMGIEERSDTTIALVVTAEHKDMKAAAIIDDLKPIPASKLTPTSESTPFADIQLKKGDLPKVIGKVCSALPMGKVNLALTLFSRMTDAVSGTLSVRLKEHDVKDHESHPRVEVSIPFHTRDDAKSFAGTLKPLVDSKLPGEVKITVDSTVVKTSAEIDRTIADHLTPGRPLVLDPSVPSPSIVAHTGLDLDGRTFDLTMAANLSRATLVVGFDKRHGGLAGAIGIVGKILEEVFTSN